MVVNKKIISRFSQYRKALIRFQELGMVKVFSDTLAEAVGVTSAQVRKDFSLYGISGNKRGGYQINGLLDELQAILGKDKIQKVIVSGCGNIGRALIRYTGFEPERIQIVAGFDDDPSKQGRIDALPILPLDAMKDFVSRNRIQIGIIAVPDSAAQPVCDTMVAAGIRGILNFAPIRLKAPDEVVINNVYLQMELENVIYFVNALTKKPRR
ncbi:MAG TPA: redox-sensing transcriptional repressor Rex [bacterium]|nr:redox-sensing transcriptional repressor Rex [bacterium]